MGDTKNPIVSVGKPLWIVRHGPDDSHLIDAEIYKKKGEAMERFDALASSRPCEVVRSAWRSPWVAEDCQQKVVARSSLRRATYSKEDPADGRG